MIKNSRSFKIVDGIENFNYEATKKNVEKMFTKYRNYKAKEEIISKRYKASLSFDNLGIYGSSPSDPVGNCYTPSLPIAIYNSKKT